jgi:threonine dehydrogenase-like Zn-dependent dehydrogenase
MAAIIEVFGALAVVAGSCCGSDVREGEGGDEFDKKYILGEFL